jgi:hypothetical protein
LIYFSGTPKTETPAAFATFAASLLPSRISRDFSVSASAGVWRFKYSGDHGFCESGGPADFSSDFFSSPGLVPISGEKGCLTLWRAASSANAMFARLSLP